MKKNSILWIFLILSIVIIFIFYRLLAILLTLLLLAVAILIYILSLTFKKKLIRTMQKHNRIVDTDLAKDLNCKIEKIRKTMTKLHNHQKNRSGLVVFLSNRYIFYNSETIDKFKQLYNKDLKEKEILEHLKSNIDLKTRAEIKAIRDTLINHKKLEEKDFEVQIKDQIRKSELY
ncbi:MAG: hypothetical protein ACFFAV_02870 [Candidatus Hermodarchaeota archaeon]